MKKDYSHIVVIIDRSGSMAGLQDEVIGGFNNFLKDQKEVPGTATMTLVQFDDQYEVNYDFVDIQSVPDLNKDTYQPRGMTAMYDAIGKTINSVGAKLAAMDESERPEKVIVMIQTDGYENASQEFTQETIKSMIEEQKNKYSWEFVFLGANIDAVTTGVNIGIDKNKAMTYVANTMGTQFALRSVSENLCAYRTGVKSSMCYEEKDYAAQQQAGL